MQVIGERVVDRLDFGIREKLFVGTVGFGYAQLSGGFLCFAQLPRRDGGDFAAFTILHCGNHFLHGDRRHSQHTPLNLCSTHSVPQYCSRILVACGCGVGTCRAISLLEFFFRANGPQIRHAVNAEDSVQMIDFMLKQFREIPQFAGLNLVRLAL